jgi:hypothetical protein
VIGMHRGVQQLLRRLSVATLVAITFVMSTFWGDEGVPRERPASMYLCAMHPDVRSASPGKCLRCRMALVRIDLGPNAGPYVCPLHPAFESTSAGSCRRCGNLLIPQSALNKYKVDLQTTPAVIAAGKPVMLRLRVLERATGTQVKDLAIVHEKPLHLFVISSDLTIYQHIHPTLQPDGTYAVETTLPQEGQYDVIADFAPVGAFPQVIRHTITTSGHRAGDESARTPLVTDPS